MIAANISWAKLLSRGQIVLAFGNIHRSRIIDEGPAVILIIACRIQIIIATVSIGKDDSVVFSSRALSQFQEDYWTFIHYCVDHQWAPNNYEHRTEGQAEMELLPAYIPVRMFYEELWTWDLIEFGHSISGVLLVIRDGVFFYVACSALSRALSASQHGLVNDF